MASANVTIEQSASAPVTALAKSTTVLVVGAGAMGSGIAQVAACAGHKVCLYDQSSAAAEKGKAQIAQNLQILLNKNKLSTKTYTEILARIQPRQSLAAAAQGVGLVIEAISENLPVKQALFAELENLLPEHAILASNTSSLSITALAAQLKRPEQCAGMHFFNPAPRMALVEIVSGLATSQDVANTLFATAEAWGKVAVMTKSTPGFIVNRVARPFYAEALKVLSEQAASPATLDAILREACQFPMGPFELMDMIGHDVNFSVTRSVYDAYFGDKRYQPSLLQQELVLAGRLGRKTGQGFYSYGKDAVKPQAQSCATIKLPAPPSVSFSQKTPAGLQVLAERLGASLDQQLPPGMIKIGKAMLALSDGRTASARANCSANVENLVLLDLAGDFASAPRLAIAKADSCCEQACITVIGVLQAAGIAVSQLDDVAGLIAMRTVCMLANEAADALLQGVASREDIDAAMLQGTNYPVGPLAWAESLGYAYVVQVLDHLHAHYGEERYRVSPWLRRQACSKQNTHG